eukprot:gnl/Spiro4/8119_TR4280_c0_g1_i1.p1 gnl/Spiro4/8119_TR4280_c0_g1~~gnl/Spiro4/8119_TR4280_c0_g1_i1.p1  ORF type:complete len:353 (-),score=52.44 gnl/Spiro4/8119_TR4280_c0_g1_i1:556-1614(-)
MSCDGRAPAIVIHASQPLGSDSSRPGNLFRVVSWNLWNYNARWETRLAYIATVVSTELPEFVVFQEIRRSPRGDQLTFLCGHLPMYHAAFHSAADANQPEKEGVAIFSLYELSSTKSVNFILKPSDRDRNPRGTLLVSAVVPKFGLINVVAVHLSYDVDYQCRNMGELLQFLQCSAQDSGSSPNTVIAGDFNIYVGFEAPVAVLSMPDPGAANPCLKEIPQGVSVQAGLPTFDDVWLRLTPLSPNSGLTFSVLPFKDFTHAVRSTGLESRPDRVFVARLGCLLPTAATVGEIENRHPYNASVYWQRLISSGAQLEVDDYWPSDHLSVWTTYGWNGDSVNCVLPLLQLSELIS